MSTEVKPGDRHVCPEGQYVFKRTSDGDDFMICQMRGWGYLTGKLGLPDDKALQIQREHAEEIAAIPQMQKELARLRGQNAEMLEALKAAQGVFENFLVELEFAHIADAAFEKASTAIAMAERKEKS